MTDKPRTRTVNLGNTTGTTESTDSDLGPDTGDDTWTGHTDDERDTTDTSFAFTDEDRKRTPSLRRMEEELAQLYVNAGLIASMFGGNGGNVAGTIIAHKADTLAGSWIDLAEKDQRVKRAIQSILQGGAWSGVIMAHVGVAMPVAAVTGLLPRRIAQQVMVGLMATDPQLAQFLANTMQAANNGQATPGDSTAD